MRWKAEGLQGSIEKRSSQSPLLLKEGASRSETGDLTLIAVRRTIKFASVRELYRSFVKA